MDVQRYGPIIATSFLTTAAAGFGIYYFYKKAHWNNELEKRAQEIVSLQIFHCSIINLIA